MLGTMSTCSFFQTTVISNRALLPLFAKLMMTKVSLSNFKEKNIIFIDKSHILVFKLFNLALFFSRYFNFWKVNETIFTTAIYKTLITLKKSKLSPFSLLNMIAE